jgi:hypothetical protein
MRARRFIRRLRDPQEKRTALRVRQGDYFREDFITRVVSDISPGEPRMLPTSPVRKRPLEFDFVTRRPSLSYQRRYIIGGNQLKGLRKYASIKFPSALSCPRQGGSRAAQAHR